MAVRYNGTQQERRKGGSAFFAACFSGIIIQMAKLSKTQIEHVANLAQIGLTEKEVNNLTTQLGGVLDFVDIIQNTNTDNIKPTDQVTGLSDVWREDEVINCKLSQEQLLSNAPDTEGGYIKVPKVL